MWAPKSEVNAKNDNNNDDGNRDNANNNNNSTVCMPVND